MYIDPSLPNHNVLIKKFNEQVVSGKHIFLFLFMDGCGPCSQTKPEWKKIKNSLKKAYPNIVVAEINQQLFKSLHGVGKEPMGYPCLRYIHHTTIEEYENSGIYKKDRSTESFVVWIESKLANKSHYHRGGYRINKTRRIKGGKWSLKYKRSINCKRPHGFSKKQHCRSKRLRLLGKL
uniref:Thioredoxin domain-containing protein n=1 Tax=viral metagenome TaxID=1070528 RepID=A0A6C0AZ41_9ZZZZ